MGISRQLVFPSYAIFASMLANNPREHRRIAENGRRHLEESLAEAETCWKGWKELLDS